MDKIYKKGDIVYSNDLKYSGDLGIKMEILDIKTEDGSIVDYKVTPLDSIFAPSFYAFPDEIFSTKEEAIIQGKKEISQLIESYKSKIQSVEDLLLYPLKNFDISDEYTDPEAVTAYIDKVKELFNIDLSEKFILKGEIKYENY